MTHLVEVDRNDDGDLYVVRFVCEADPLALCRAWCADGCEEECVAREVYVSAEPVEPVAQAPVEGHRFAPMGEGRCRVVEWLGAGNAEDALDLYAGDDLDRWNRAILRPGRHPIEESWDGDSYLWEYAEQPAAVRQEGQE